MTHYRMVVVLLAAALLAGLAPLALSADPSAAPATSRPDAPPLPDAAAVKQLADSGKYAEALLDLSRILALSGSPAAAYDRHQMLMLKAECQIHLRQSSLAMDTLAMASQEATNAHDVKASDEATALAYLLQKSSANLYTPKTGTDKKPIDILDPANRPAAYTALLADSLPAIKQQAAAAESGTTLPPMMDVAKTFGNIRAVERAATGATSQTDSLSTGLAASAAKLINNALNNFQATAKRIGFAADVRHYGRRVGLNAEQAQQLRTIVSTCDEVSQAVTDLAAAFGQPLPGVNTSQADAIKALANKVLTAG